MSDNPEEMYQRCTVKEVPLIAPFTEIKEHQTTLKCLTSVLLSSKMMIFILRFLADSVLLSSKMVIFVLGFLAGSWLSLSKAL